MRLVILGAGAIGGVLGAHLALAGRDVLVLARGEHLAAIRRDGLRLERPDGKHVAKLAAQDPREPIAWRAGDVLVLATKTQDAAAALRDVAAPPEIPIACATNGVEAERIALRFARDVYAITLRLPATYLVPGVVQAWAAPAPGVLEIGHYPDGHGEHAHAIAGELGAAGFACEVRANAMAWKRQKLLMNLMNGAEALAGPAARMSPLAARVAAEARACYAAAGLSCVTDAQDGERRAQLQMQPIPGATYTGGSTWQSLARGRSLETDYLNGEIAMLGRLHGVPTPVNEAFQNIVAAAVRDGAAPGAMAVAELERRVG